MSLIAHECGDPIQGMMFFVLAIHTFASVCPRRLNLLSRAIALGYANHRAFHIWLELQSTKQPKLKLKSSPMLSLHLLTASSTCTTTFRLRLPQSVEQVTPDWRFPYSVKLTHWQPKSAHLNSWQSWIAQARQAERVSLSPFVSARTENGRRTRNNAAFRSNGQALPSLRKACHCCERGSRKSTQP